MSQLARTCSNPGWIRQPGEELSILEAASSVGFCANEAEVAGLIYQLVVRELAHKINVSNRLSAGNP